MLVAGRVINGLSVGICSAQVPVYISELAPPSKRGRLVGSQQWAITWGIMIMFYVSYGCSFIEGPAAFRIPWALQMIPAILLFIGMSFLPESPRWLARRDRWQEAHDVLTLVHGKGDPTSPFVEREMREIREIVDFEKNNADVTYLELLKPNMINRTHIGVFTQIWSQLTGMNVMMCVPLPHPFSSDPRILTVFPPGTTSPTSSPWPAWPKTPTSSPRPSNTSSTWS